MFALRVEYLTGRVIAARFEDGDAKHSAEWPPHPARLFSALVAAWGETGQNDTGRHSLEWLEQLSPPALAFPPASSRPTVQVYVPINDSNEQFKVKKDGIAFHPSIGGDVEVRRSRQPRAFPSLSLPDTEKVVFFIWREAAPTSEQRAALAVLARYVTYLGHSSSLVSVSLCDDPPPDKFALVPDANGDRRLRVPSPGRLEYLEKQFRKFQINPIKVNRPNAGASARYAASDRAASPSPSSSVFGEVVVLRRVLGDRFPLTSTLQLTAALRGAVLAAGPQPIPEYISGHAPGSTPAAPRPSNQPHIAFVPLADVGHRQARGHLLGLGILLPRTFTEAETTVVFETLAAVRRLEMGDAGAWTVETVSVEATNAQALGADTWMRLPDAPASTRWATVTPLVFDRHPKNHHGEEAQRIIADACVHIGLPRPSQIFPIQVSPHYGVPTARSFPAALPRPGKPRRWHIHVLLCFPEPVAGPLAIGAGRYYGYGFCRPLPD